MMIFHDWKQEQIRKDGGIKHIRDWYHQHYGLYCTEMRKKDKEAFDSGPTWLPVPPDFDPNVIAARSAWRMVPITPTNEMVAKGEKAGITATPAPWCPAAWDAMVKSAPVYVDHMIERLKDLLLSMKADSSEWSDRLETILYEEVTFPGVTSKSQAYALGQKMNKEAFDSGPTWLPVPPDFDPNVTRPIYVPGEGHDYTVENPELFGTVDGQIGETRPDTRLLEAMADLLIVFYKNRPIPAGPDKDAIVALHEAYKAYHE